MLGKVEAYIQYFFDVERTHLHVWDTEELESAKLYSSSMMAARLLTDNAGPKTKLMLCYIEGLTGKITSVLEGSIDVRETDT